MIGTDRPLIVVGLDDSPDAAWAARWAVALFGPLQPRLRLAHVPVGSEPVSRAPDWLSRLARALSADVLVRRPSAGADVAAVLADLTTTADLLVLGSYGEGSGGGARVGTTAIALLTRAACPIAVVRGPRQGEPPDEDGPVVVGYDGSPGPDAVLALAADLADVAKAPLIVTHTWSEFATDPVAGSYQVKAPWDALARRAAEVTDRAVRIVMARHPDLEVARHVLGDTPLGALLDAADGARMVVVGRHRAQPAAHRRLGSTSLGLVEFAPCPVVVIPPVGSDECEE